MKSLANLVSGIQKMTSLGIAGAFFLGNMGCAPMPQMTKAQKTALVGQTLIVLGSINTPKNNTPEGNRAKEILTTSGALIVSQAQMRHDLEVAGAGRSEIVINNNVPDYKNNSSQNYNSNKNYNTLQNSNPPKGLENRDDLTPQGLFMYKKFVDFNQDGHANRSEYIGLNEPFYNLNSSSPVLLPMKSLFFSFYGGNQIYWDDLDLKIYDLGDGSVINHFSTSYGDDSGVKNFECDSNCFSRSGNYRAVFNAINNKKTFYLDFEIVK